MTAVPSTTKSRKGPPFGPSLALLLVGLAIAIPGVVVAAIAFVSMLDTPTTPVPGSTRLELGSGEYIVYERIGGTNRVGPLSFTKTRGLSVEPGSVTVIGRDGNRVPVEEARHNESINRSDEHFLAAVRFDVPEAGDYTLHFRGTRTGEVIVQRSLGHEVRAHAPWLVSIGVGWVCALVGVVALLTGVIRRGGHERRIRRALVTTAVPGVAPAGWYPDPTVSRRWRYWDGERWTEHSSDW